jgi:hypothetical protein
MFTWFLPSIASPASPRVDSRHDLRERTMRLRSKTTGVSVANAGNVQGLSSYQSTPFDSFHQHMCSLGPRNFKDVYSRALSLERKTASELDTLLEKLLSWVILVTDGDGLPDDALPDGITLEQLRELWEKARYSVRAALAVLKNEPTPRPASTRPPGQSSMKRWLVNLVRLS